MPKDTHDLKNIAEQLAKEHLEGFEFLSVSEEYGEELTEDEMNTVHDFVIRATPTIN